MKMKAAPRPAMPSMPAKPAKRSFPMPDKVQMAAKGKLSTAAAAKIRAKASRMLGA